MLRRKGFEFEHLFDERDTVMSVASQHVVACEESTPVTKVIKLMLSGYRKIPIHTSKGFSGIVTITDILDYAGAGDRYQEFLKSDHPLEEPVQKVMAIHVATIDSRATLGQVRDVFKDLGRGSYPVLRKGRVVGMIADWDFLKKVNHSLDIAVGDVMIPKPAKVKNSYPLIDVAKMMVKGGYRRLPVTKMDILTGIVVPADIFQLLSSDVGIDALRTEKRPVSKAMHEDVVTISPEDGVGRAATLMLKHKIGGLPVTEDDELIGMITESDIVQAML